VLRRLGQLLALITLISVSWLAWQYYGPRPKGPPLAASIERIDHILIEKSANTLTASLDGEIVMQAQISLGFSPTGDKQQEGDGKTPEGLFSIDRRNPRSSFYLSLGIDYPQPEDIARAKAAGLDPGGDIFIHGQPNALDHLVTLNGDWTEGCIAISNEQMAQLWSLAPIGTLVEIRP